MTDDDAAFRKYIADHGLPRMIVRDPAFGVFSRLGRDDHPNRLLYWQRTERTKGFQMWSDPLQVPASAEPPILPEDARAIFDSLCLVYGSLGYRLEWLVTQPKPPEGTPQEFPDGLHAVPKNEPTAGYGRRLARDRCVFVTADGNGFEAAIRALADLPPLKPSGLRALTAADEDFLAATIRAARLGDVILAYLRTARARRADSPPALPAITIG